MACFNLTAHQRSLLASCIEIGAEGLMDSDEAETDIAAIDAFLAELQGEAAETAGDIEITVSAMDDGEALASEMGSGLSSEEEEAYGLYETTGDERLRTVM